jgi:hypothetical protein
MGLVHRVSFEVGSSIPSAIVHTHRTGTRLTSRNVSLLSLSLGLASYIYSLDGTTAWQYACKLSSSLAISFSEEPRLTISQLDTLQSTRPLPSLETCILEPLIPPALSSSPSVNLSWPSCPTCE